VQRIDATGAALWTADGVALCTAADEQLSPFLASDGAGGAIVVWQDGRSGAGWDVYARRVNAAGSPQWAADGMAVSVLAGSNQSSPRLIEDDFGGVIVVWTDFRAGNSDIYAQRLNASGNPQWLLNGVPVCTAANTQSGPDIISDGAAGAIVAWEDSRTGNYDIYAQHIRPSSAMAWLSGGVVLCSEAGSQSNLGITTDGAGGAIVAWQDNRTGVEVDIYAQRVNDVGAAVWDYNGLAVCTAAGLQNPPVLLSDGAGGAIATWQDDRFDNDVYAQAISAPGVARWLTDGVPLGAAVRDQMAPVAAEDGAGGVIAAWNDGRSGGNHVYGQRAEPRYGYWGRPEPTIVSAEDNPDDQGGKVILRWLASQRDRFDNPAISHYSVWRSTDFVAAPARQGTASEMVIVKSPLDVRADFAGAAVWERTGANGPEYWEWIANLDAFYKASYSFTAPTRQDSVGGNPALHYFSVVAHEYDYPQTRAWESGTVSTYSVDNLAPAAPLMLTAQRVGADVRLRWNRVAVPDLRDYSVYRATASGVTPVPVNFLSSADDTVLIDAGAPTSSLYYIVTAIDIHENPSPPSNEASVGALTGIGDTPPITALTVLPNHPNPFTGSTELEIGLPGDADVRIEVYDVAGRRVREASLARRKAGWQKVAFDGRNDAGQPLPSGVYFCRVTAAGASVTHKMVIAR
jgi:hypothetical protein